MHWTTGWKLFLIGWISLLSQVGSAQDPQQTWQLANHYYESNDYETALSTFQRYLFFKEDKAFYEGAYRIAECYLNLNQFEQATAWFDYTYQLAETEDERVEVVLKKAAMYLKANNPQFSLLELYSLPDTLTPEYLARKQFFLAAAYITLEEYARAEKSMERFYSLHNREQEFMNMQQLFADTVHLRRVSPAWAGIMSLIIPGSGQLYAGYPKEAANSFLLVGMLEFAFIYIAHRYSLLNAYTSIFPWLQRYYFGGYVAARKLAYKKREERKEAFYEHVLQEAFKLSGENFVPQP